MVYVLPNRQGLNFFRWLWLSTNLFVRVVFHDLQKEINNGKQVIYLLPYTYLIYKTIETRNTVLQGAGQESTVIKQKGNQYPVR